MKLLYFKSLFINYIHLLEFIKSLIGICDIYNRILTSTILMCNIRSRYQQSWLFNSYFSWQQLLLLWPAQVESVWPAWHPSCQRLQPSFDTLAFSMLVPITHFVPAWRTWPLLPFCYCSHHEVLAHACVISRPDISLKARVLESIT